MSNLSFLSRDILTTYLPTEVVLSVLLPAFAFEVTDKPIAWNASAVMYPTMGEESEKPELLLKVKALKT